MAVFIGHAPPGLTLYLLISNAAGQIRRTDTTTFEAEDLTHLPQYAYPLTAGAIPFRYTADIPADLPGGANGATALYGIQVMQQVDVEPSGQDEALGQATLYWDGTQEVPQPTLAAIADAAVEAAGAALGAGASDALHAQIFGYERDGFDRPVDGRLVIIELANPPQFTSTAILESARRITYSNAQGYWVIPDAVRGKSYRIIIDEAGIDETFTVPDAPLLDFRAYLESL